MRKVLSAILAMMLIVSLAVPSFAAATGENAISPRYTYIKMLTAHLSIDENSGVSNSRASCYSANGYTVEIECKLQRQTSSGWSTLKTWTATGSGYASINQDWAVASGYTYQAYITYRICNAAGTVLESTSTSRTYVYPPN